MNGPDDAPTEGLSLPNEVPAQSWIATQNESLATAGGATGHKAIVIRFNNWASWETLADDGARRPNEYYDRTVVHRVDGTRSTYNTMRSGH